MCHHLLRVLAKTSNELKREISAHDQSRFEWALCLRHSCGFPTLAIRRDLKCTELTMVSVRIVILLTVYQFGIRKKAIPFHRSLTNTDGRWFSD
jgi:hypothetical protein